MNNKYFKEASEKLNKIYNINVLDDILLTSPNKVIMFSDTSKNKNLELEVISGNLETIGFDDNKSIKLSEILDAFDYNNKYGQINGKNKYFEDIYQQINDFSKPTIVSFPIINKGIRKWLRFNIFPCQKLSNISVFTIMDVTKLHTQEEENFAKTHIDSLTNLYNKYTFDFHYANVYKKPGFHVMFMDIDNFKEVNDKYGHSIGNAYLVAFANLLKSFENEDINFYRLGGDEFVGLLIGNTKAIKDLAANIVDGIKELNIANSNITLTLSMGVIKANRSFDLARKADDLMYKVKKTGKNNYIYAVE
ncbi:MAG: GGDEF domain-containing protein [Bacillota bacterium]